MCGILGWAGAGSKSFDAEQFAQALTTLRHRGPDDHGVWADERATLGHRRLSIIDLSAAGHQPMASRSGQNIITFNGEIYNYKEIQRELAGIGVAPKGGSDTGVLLEAIESWGPERALSKLNGMWAFAVWNPVRRQLLLARDRFGVKPLYLLRQNGSLAFASEPKALLCLYPEFRRMRERTMLDFLSKNHLFVDGKSFYEGIDLLPPAHFLLYDVDRDVVTKHRYWDYPTDMDQSVDAQKAVDEFASIFTDAVALRMRSDVPVGLSLSGGLDSSAVLSSMASNKRSAIPCYTSTYENPALGELRWAGLATERAGAVLTPVLAQEGAWLETLQTIVWHMDSPGYSPAVFPLWQLMRRARADGVPVLLEGQGADEALGGYPQYAVLDLMDRVAGRGPRESPLKTLRRIMLLKATFSLRWSAAWLARESSPALLRWHRAREGFQSLLRRGVAIDDDLPMSTGSPHDRVHDRLVLDHSKMILPGLLHYGDSISMAHSVEARNPFLDYRLVEWMFRLPTQFKIHDGQTKWVLRQYLRNHGMADIGNRQDKRGYPTPIRSWLASTAGRDFEYELTRHPGPLLEWIDPRKVNALFERHRAGSLTSEHHLYKLLSAHTWINRCLQTEPQRYPSIAA